MSDQPMKALSKQQIEERRPPDNAGRGKYTLIEVQTLRTLCDMALAHLSGKHTDEVRPCTCHPDDNPPRPCPQKFALTECRAAAESMNERGASPVARSPDVGSAAAADADITADVPPGYWDALQKWMRGEAPDGRVLAPKEPSEEMVSTCLQTFRSEMNDRMETSHPSSSPGHDSMRIALRKTLAALGQDKSLRPPLPANQQNAVAAQSEGWVSDAKRYRWLKARTEYRSLAHNKWLRLPDFQLPDGPRDGRAPDKLDAAIDAAMSAAPTVNEAPKQGAKE